MYAISAITLFICMECLLHLSTFVATSAKKVKAMSRERNGDFFLDWQVIERIFQNPAVQSNAINFNSIIKSPFSSS